MFLAAITLAFIGVRSISAVAEQRLSVECVSEYSWALNNRQQNPCKVAAYLQGACSSRELLIESLNIQPTALNSCMCNSVVYSLISACADCQQRSWHSRSEWAANCSTIWSNEYPHDIPLGTAIPNWAYLDVTQSSYDPVLARAIAGLNKSRNSFRIQARAANGGGSSTGIITGAVVGGVLLVGLIAAIIALYLDRKSHKPPPPTYQWLDSAGLTVGGAIPVAPRAQNLPQVPPPVVTQLPPIPSTSPIYLSPSQTIPPQSSSPPPNQHTVYTQPSPPPLSHLSTDVSQYSAPSFYNPDQRQHHEGPSQGIAHLPRSPVLYTTASPPPRNSQYGSEYPEKYSGQPELSSG